jgi:hypothetical protein
VVGVVLPVGQPARVVQAQPARAEHPPGEPTEVSRGRSSVPEQFGEAHERIDHGVGHEAGRRELGGAELSGADQDRGEDGFSTLTADEVERTTAGDEIAHEVEQNISTYLFTVTLINMGVGVAVGVGVWPAFSPTSPT